MDAIKLFMLDDHEAIRKGYAWFIEQEEDMELRGEASTIAEADQWFESNTADIAIVDISLKDENGIDFIEIAQ
ncbi:MAG: response regulator transcription factor [Candidatus Omnitrophica bacterium]|nr:response regulator transcription factor [Candidatus Omnitrophota bacterium]